MRAVSMSKTIPLSQGLFAIVDDDDFDELNQWKWHAYKDGNSYYAVRNINMINSVRTTKRMHRIILSAKRGEYIDHINGDGLDNRKCNLRICTNAENRRNQRISSANTSGYKGVSWHSSNNKWRAQIKLNGKCVYQKHFFCLMKAVRGYNEAAIKYHGEFAKINKI